MRSASRGQRDTGLFVHDRCAGRGVELVSIEDFFRRSYFLSVICPPDGKARGVVSARLLGPMKLTTFAGLDIFEEESTAADEAHAVLDNVTLTPHCLRRTDQRPAEIGTAKVRAFLAVQRGDEPAGLVKREITGDTR